MFVFLFHFNPQLSARTGIAFKFSSEHSSFLLRVLDTLQSQAV